MNVNVCEHKVKMAPVTISSKSHQGKEQEDGKNERSGSKIEKKLSEVNTRLSGE